MNKGITYKDAGVDINSAEKSVKKIAELAKSTFTKNVLRNIGLFGAFFQLDVKNYANPVLVSSVDGVGTKLKIAFMSGIHNTVGEDLVNHCVNDIMTSGAVPLYFLDYIALGKLDRNILIDVVEGLARGCRNVECSLIGGETAEMPDFYNPGEYDISGTIVGIVDQEKVIDGSKIEAGDILIGVPSSGLHTNGYSLVRKIFFDLNKQNVNDYIDELGCTIAEELLKVHKSYRKLVISLKDEPFLHGMSHITGGGIKGNTKRILSDDLKLRIDWNSWQLPPIFKVIQNYGHVAIEEMRHVFNLGIGFIFVVNKQHVDETCEIIKSKNDNPIIIGEICANK